MSSICHAGDGTIGVARPIKYFFTRSPRAGLDCGLNLSSIMDGKLDFSQACHNRESVSCASRRTKHLRVPTTSFLVGATISRNGRPLLSLRIRRRGFDHVGIFAQIDLPTMLLRDPVRGARAICCGVGLVQKQPKAAPYVLTAFAIAAAIWTLLGSPHSPRPVTQFARSYVSP
jgi:hypothetical protein